MKKVLTILLVGALLMASIPAVVYAGHGSVTGHGKGGNTKPVVTAVTLVTASDDTEVTAMTPLDAYRVKATVGDVNTINDIEYIMFYVYYDGTASTSWDADEYAIFKWDKSAGWSMENGGATTTWEIVSIDCIAPTDFSGTPGDWYLKFKPGKLAQAVDTQTWKCKVKAYDEKPGGSAVEVWTTGSSMSAYSAVAFDAATITLGDAVEGIEPGSTGYITDPVTNELTVKVTTNDSYALGVQSDATWDDGGSNSITLAEGTGIPGGSGEFNLEIDNEESGAPGQPATGEAVTSSNVTILGFETKPRVSTTETAAEGTNDADMYMALSLSLTGIQEVTYSGTITFTVTN